MAPSGSKEFGAWLEKNRTAAKMTQKDIARLTGVTTRTVIRWEAGEGAPGGEAMWLIFSALGYPTPSDRPRAVNVELAAVNKRLDEMQSAFDRVSGALIDMTRRLGSVLRDAE
jgi:transcriptional regulator with XRE-family HTH domain